MSEQCAAPGSTLVAFVRVEGSNCALLGAATAALDRVEVMDECGQPFWGCRLDICCDEYHLEIKDLDTNFASAVAAGRVAKKAERCAPGRQKAVFPVPCVVRVTIDGGAGTLSMSIVGGEDLGVVVSGLPTDVALHLAAGTGEDSSFSPVWPRLTLLDGEQVDEERATGAPCIYSHC